ncbi:MAG: hypothetical protein JWM28_490 [Chitinophagaceae bacterium]|nr:hypothetical protein [Chitinophagaceae bacterium]
MFYTDYFLLLCQLIAIGTIIHFFKKQKLSRFFLTYCLSSFTLVTSEYFILYFCHDISFREKLTESTNVIFSLIEYIVFYTFLKLVLVSPVIKSFLKFYIFIFVTAALFFFYRAYFTNADTTKLKHITDFIISSELFVIAACCIVYFYELFIKEPLLNLSESPAFWIITGLFCYSILIIPFFMISGFVYSQKTLYYIFFGVHYISFGFLFLAISKAFLCRKPIEA